MAHVIDQHSSHTTIAKLQRSINRRGKHRGVSIAADGEFGPKTRAAQDTIAHRLGVSPVGGSTKAVAHSQNIVRHPGYRSPAELARATKVIRAWRKAEKARSDGPNGAIQFARRYIGKTEHPAGSNRGTWGLNDWERQLAGGGSYLNGAPWCGIMLWASLSKGGGVKGLTSRCASVNAIYQDAAAGRNGFRSRHSRTAGQPGDALILFSTSTHVEIVERRVPGGYVSIGGNTSFANGSQSDGGAVARKTRPYSSVVACCRPRY